MVRLAPCGVLLLAAATHLLGCARYDYELGGGLAAGAPGAGGATGGGAGGAGGATGSEVFPFSAPTLLTALSDPVEDDDDPTLTADLLEIYFSSARSGGLGEEDIWRSVRPSAEVEWEAPELVVELSSDADETSVAIAPDGLTIWIASDRGDAASGIDVWISERADRASAWDEPTRVASLSTDGDEIVRSTSRWTDGVLLAARPTDVVEYDLYEASGDPSAGYAARSPLAGLNTESNEADPFLASDALTLYFTSNRDADAGDELLMARRPTTSEPYAVVRALAELNSPDHDTDPWVSTDQRLILFASDRNDGQLDLFEARR